ncbi:hypothetical protein [Pseudomonas sp. QD4]|uniref:hypothetical protein n=1 Tax=Pseudomonas sp. QD4 TaxID=3368618 RepID=UPI003BA33A17
MIIKFFLALTFAPWLVSSAQAEWKKSEIKDEMRSETTTVFRQTEMPISGTGPEVTLMILDKDDGHPGVVLSLDKGKADGCPSLDSSFCKVSVKFDEGKVREENFSTDDGVHLVPTQVVSFAGTVTKAKRLFIEVDVKGYGPLQYKFQIEGLAVRIDRSPRIKIYGYELGESYPNLEISLQQTKSEGLDVCYSGSDVAGVVGDVKVKKINICFYNGVFYTALIIPGTKSSYEAIVKYLKSEFGKPDPDRTYPSWPDDGDKVINRSTKRAAYVTFGKNRFGDFFVISDDIVDPLIPEAPKP